MSRGREFTRHVAVYLGARALPAAVNFGLLVAYTHVLSPAEYGTFALWGAWAGIGSALLFQWVTSGVRRFAIGWTARWPGFLATIGVVFLACVLLTGAGGLGAALVFPAIGLGATLVVLGMLWSQSWGELNLELSLARIRPGEYARQAIGRSIIIASLGIALVHAGWGPLGAAVAVMVGGVVPTIPALAQDWPEARHGTPDRRFARDLMRYGGPLMASFGLQFIVNFSDRLLLARFSGTASVGTYATAYDLTQQTLIVLMMVVNSAAFPLAVRAFETEGMEGARAQLRLHCAVLTGVALPATVGLALLAPTLSTVLFGDEYRAGAAMIIPIVAVAVFLAGFKAFYLDLAFQLGRATMGQVWVTLLAAALVTGLNLVWIPKYGVLGASWATLVAFAVALVASAIVGRGAFPLPFPVRDLGRILGAVVAMGGALVLLGNGNSIGGLAWRIIAGATVYGGATLLLDPCGVRQVTVKLVGMGAEA